MDIQAAAYALLYKEHHNGKYPAGFLLYYLSEKTTNNTFFVKGDSIESQTILESNVQHVVTNIRNGSFPRKISNQCARCDYYMECRPNGKISVSLPGAIPDSIQTEENKPAEEYVQLELVFKKKEKNKQTNPRLVTKSGDFLFNSNPSKEPLSVLFFSQVQTVLPQTLLD